MKRLDQQTALITGGASGVGAATAELFAQEGARVFIADIQDDLGQALANKIGEQASYIHLDVSDEANWRSAVDEVIASTGKIDVLVNNAGIIKFAGLLDQTAEDMQQILNVNVMGVMLGTQAAARHMIPAGKGAIVNISSADGLSSANALGPYCASKWAVRGYTKSTALELGHQGIRVNSIHPGGIDTPLANVMQRPREEFDMGFKGFPAQRCGAPLEVAQAALYLASDESSYCMGTELAVDGGMTAGHYYHNLPGAPEPFNPNPKQ